ncbi:unnamed protein product [Caenorhabditis brenneri]
MLTGLFKKQPPPPSFKMEQQLSRARIPVLIPRRPIDSVPPPPQPRIQNQPDFHYSTYSPSSSPPRDDQHVETVYRRNDPSNRMYRMKKRPPAQVYHCVQCNKNIKYPSKITEHIRKHTGEKPHVCVVCHQSFSQAHTLKAHMLMHEHEKPYKCSFCPMGFALVHQKDEHEEEHMDHPEAIDGPRPILRPQFFRVRQAPPIQEAEPTQMCQIYECPEMCGFQSFEETEVIEHISIVHSYDNVCWEEEEQGGSGVGAEGSVEDQRNVIPQVPDAKMNGINVIPVQVQPGMIVRNFPNPPGRLYEYFSEPFVPEVASEAIIDDATSEDVESNNYHHNHFNGTVAGPSEIPIVSDQILYEGDEEIVEVNTKPEEMKREVIPPDLYENIIIHQNLEEEDEVEECIVNDEIDDDEQEEKVRIILNPNPPKRGTKSLRDHHEATAAMTEMIVDASTLEMAAPTRHLKQLYPPGKRRGRGKKKPENLDWIIDAVAKGVDVNEASPHVRKKPTLHKCEYCGKVDKYPSKIRAHMRTHTGEKPFKCDICGMAFSQKTPMRLHLRRHFDQKPYECDVDGCKERFVSGAILKMHVEKKHLNKKKYVCIRGCGRVFSSAFNQRHHEKKCSQQTFFSWVDGGGGENVETGEEDEESNGEYQDDDEEDYMEEMMDPTISDEPIEVTEHFVEEPVFLHQ